MSSKGKKGLNSKIKHMHAIPSRSLLDLPAWDWDVLSIAPMRLISSTLY